MFAFAKSPQYLGHSIVVMAGDAGCAIARLRAARFPPRSWILGRTNVPVARSFPGFLPASYVGRCLPHTPVRGTTPVSTLLEGAG